jgi:hypothetical protein
MSEYKFEGKKYSEEMLAEMSNGDLLELHNKIAEAIDAETRSGFRNKTAGVKAALSLLVGYAAQKPAKKGKAKAATEEGEEAPAKPKKARKAKAATEEGEGGQRGRKSSFAGKCFYPSKVTKDEGNQYREDSQSWRTMEMIINDPGISYEDLVEKNARMNTLRDAISRGLAEAK